MLRYEDKRKWRKSEVSSEMLRVKNTGFRGDRGGIHHNTTYSYAATEFSPSISGSLKRKLQIQSRAASTGPEAVWLSGNTGNCQERAVCLQSQAFIVKSSNNYFGLVKSLVNYHY